MVSRKYWFVLPAALAFSGAALAQTQPAPAPAAKQQQQVAPSATEIEGGVPKYIKDETPEERRLRVGNEDPGPNPDPKKIFYRYGKEYTIERYDRQWASYKDMNPGWVRPFAFANFANEIYQQNDKYVWVWHEQAAPELPAAVQEELESVYTEPQLNYLQKIRPEFTTVTPPETDKTIRFEDASTGLPKTGSWRNVIAVGDMNGDGKQDLIAPPQRGGGGTLPIIFLGDGKGSWKVWESVVWPYTIQYGSAAAADFNKDGKTDLAFGVHLTGVRVFLGDNKGNFTDASTGLPANDYPTRRIVVTDLDRDGWTDILAIHEGPAPAVSADLSQIGKVRAFLNRQKGTKWEALNAAAPKHIIGGDWLAVGKFNEDPYPDFVGGSIFYQASELVYRSDAKNKWSPVKSDGELVPYLSYYYGVTAGRFSSKDLDDAIMSYVRFWPNDVPKTIPAPESPSIMGIDRITFSGKEPKRSPIVRFVGTRPILGVGSADFDGDGKTDLIYSPYDPREFVLLLGDGKGGFARAKLEGITAEKNTNYDLTVADVNNDKRPDVVVMYESAADSKFGFQDGSIRVFLNRGPATPAAASK